MTAKKEIFEKKKKPAPKPQAPPPTENQMAESIPYGQDVGSGMQELKQQQAQQQAAQQEAEQQQAQNENQENPDEGQQGGGQNPVDYAKQVAKDRAKKEIQKEVTGAITKAGTTAAVEGGATAAGVATGPPGWIALAITNWQITVPIIGIIITTVLLIFAVSIFFIESYGCKRATQGVNIVQDKNLINKLLALAGDKTAQATFVKENAQDLLKQLQDARKATSDPKKQAEFDKLINQVESLQSNSATGDAQELQNNVDSIYNSSQELKKDIPDTNPETSTITYAYVEQGIQSDTATIKIVKSEKKAYFYDSDNKLIGTAPINLNSAQANGSFTVDKIRYENHAGGSASQIIEVGKITIYGDDSIDDSELNNYMSIYSQDFDAIFNHVKGGKTKIEITN